MSAAFVLNTGGLNLDSSVSTLTTGLVAASGYNVIHIGIRSGQATVLSVTDDAATPNTYTKAVGIGAKTEEDYTVDEYDVAPKGSIFHDSVRGESWTATVSNACKNVIVTLTSGAKFAVQCNNYTSGSGIGSASATAVALVSSSAPSATLIPNATTSIISAGFVTATLLNQAAGTGTMRGTIAGATAETGIAITTVDHTGTTPLVASLAPVNTEVLDGSTFTVPATYAVTAVEIKA